MNDENTAISDNLPQAEQPGGEPATDTGQSLGEVISATLDQMTEGDSAAAEQPQEKTGEGEPPQVEAEQPQDPWDADAPEAWDKEGKAAWDYLKSIAAKGDPQAQKYIGELCRRAYQVEEYGKKCGEEVAAMREHVEAASRFSEAMRPVGEAIAQLEPYFKQFAGPDGGPLWGNPQSIAQEFLALAQTKAEMILNPVQGMTNIIHWCRAQGVDMNAVLGAVVQGAQDWPDADSVRAQAEAQRYKAQAEFYQRQQAEQQQMAMRGQQIAALGQTFEQTIQAKGPDGQLAYPHLHGEHAEEVGKAAGRFIRANIDSYGGLSEQLFKDAYHAAVSAHPTLKQIERQKWEAELAARQNARAKQAKSARGFVPSGSTVGKEPPARAMSLGEAAERAFEEIISQ